MLGLSQRGKSEGKNEKGEKKTAHEGLLRQTDESSRGTWVATSFSLTSPPKPCHPEDCGFCRPKDDKSFVGSDGWIGCDGCQSVRQPRQPLSRARIQLSGRTAAPFPPAS